MCCLQINFSILKCEHALRTVTCYYIQLSEQHKVTLFPGPLEHSERSWRNHDLLILFKQTTRNPEIFFQSMENTEPFLSIWFTQAQRRAKELHSSRFYFLSKDCWRWTWKRKMPLHSACGTVCGTPLTGFRMATSLRLRASWPCHPKGTT